MSRSNSPICTLRASAIIITALESPVKTVIAFPREFVNTANHQLLDIKRFNANTWTAFHSF
jgi:hypothetical protein